MNYDGLETAYWNAQIARVEKLRTRISERAAAPVGRVVPDDADLTIGTGRRLDLTVMFIDITGFSQRPSNTPEEQELMLRVLNLFMTEMIRIAEDHGGSVEKNTGDGLMAYFEDDAEANSSKRAVACALTMHAANTLLIAPILRATGVPPLEFRVSMDFGPVMIAKIGAAQRFNANVAIGATANFASKMIPNLKAGEIGLGTMAWARLPDYWRTTWSQISPISTGWTWGPKNTPYGLWLYTGRWNKLI